MRRASEAEKARLNETFAALCAIPSPFGDEAAVAAHVTRELEGMGLAVEADAKGNLLTRVRGRSDEHLLLCAHLDTVAVTGPIEPVLVDGGWENAHDAILGADNKAAVAVFLELAAPRAPSRARRSASSCCSPSRRRTRSPARRPSTRRSCAARIGYVLDHATPIGGVVVGSPTYYRIRAEFHGRAAHAGIRPEDGRSAVLAAAHAITTMPHGRIDEVTTANVGSVQGGVGSTNVVPERCSVLAEARSLDPDRVETVVAQIVDALHDGAAHGECDVDVVTEKLFTGYRQKASTPAVVAAEAALRACGYAPERIVTGGGSDANALELQGITCVNLANGTERNHEPTERVSVAALEGMLDVCLTLVDEVAAIITQP